MASPLGRFIQSVTVQDAIYWGGLEHDGSTSFKYNLVKEIKVRWDELSQLERQEIGAESGSQAKLLVNEDLSIGGYVLLGSLGDETNTNLPDGMRVVKNDTGGTKHRYILINGERIQNNSGEDITTEWHPKGLAGAYQIIRFSKVPEFASKTDFIRTAYV